MVVHCPLDGANPSVAVYRLVFVSPRLVMGIGESVIANMKRHRGPIIMEL